MHKLGPRQAFSRLLLEAFSTIEFHCLFLSPANLCYTVKRLGTEVIIMEGMSL
jgi:hypothetical protein